jgi:3-oxoacyl-[acyl-carrier protein] reductase
MESIMEEHPVMLITGDSHGVGKQLVSYYAGKGYEVVGVSRSPVTEGLPHYHHFSLDVGDEAAVVAFFGQVREQFGRVDVLINNAGAFTKGYAMLLDGASVQKSFTTNFLGAYLFSREASKMMKARSYGRIVNISSIAVPLHAIGSSVYSAMKAAVEQFSTVFAKETYGFGITVNTVGFSVVDADGMRNELSEKVIQATLDLTITHRMVSVDDITNALDFFISEKSGGVSGQLIYLGGS